MALTNQKPCKQASLRNYRKTCTNYFGCPKGESGRPDGVAVQGIVIHYLGVTQDTYTSLNMVGPMPPVTTDHHSMHYTISPEGTILNHVAPDDLAWAHTTCASNWAVPLDPPYSYPGFPLLSAANPAVPLDYYTINIGITAGGERGSSSRCTDESCDGWTFGLRERGYTELVRLLAELSSEYGIVVSSEYIQFHEYVEDVDSVENVPCFNGCLVCDVMAYCGECENYRDQTYSNESDIESMAALYGETLEGCKAKICIDDLLATWDGTSPLGTLSITNDGEGSPNSGHTPDIDVNVSACDGQLLVIADDGLCTAVATGPGVQGDGTPGNPIRADLCTFAVPDGTIGQYVGVDNAGCLVKADLPEETVFAATNGDGAISITAGGTAGHTPAINIRVASGADCTPNLLSITPSGLCVQVATEAPITGDGTPGNPIGLDMCGIDAITPDGTPTVYLGVDNAGCVVKGQIPAPPAPETTWQGTQGGIVNITAGGVNGHGPTIEALVSNGVGIQGDGTPGNPIIVDRCDLIGLAQPEPLEWVGGYATDNCLARENSDEFVRSRIDALDTNCIATTWDQANGVISVDPIIAPSFPGLAGGCNGLVCSVDGLAVAPEKEHVCADSPFLFFFSPRQAFAVGDSNPASLAETFLDVTNDSPCYDLVLRVFMLGFIEMSAGESELVTQFAGEGLYEWTQDGGTTWTPYSIIHTHAHAEAIDGSGQFPSINGVANDSKTECVIVPPSGSIRLGVRGGYTVWRGHSSAFISQVARISVSGGHA